MLLIKIKQQDLLHDDKNISDSIAYFMRVYNRGEKPGIGWNDTILW